MYERQFDGIPFVSQEKLDNLKLFLPALIHLRLAGQGFRPRLQNFLLFLGSGRRLLFEGSLGILQPAMNLPPVNARRRAVRSHFHFLGHIGVSMDIVD